jgi:hypothetical protein
VKTAWPSNQSALWRYGGLGLAAAALGLTALMVGRGPRPLRPSEDRGLFGTAPRGLRGTLTEAFGRGRLVVDYGSVEGQREDLRLRDVAGRLEEDAALWTVAAPEATRRGGEWTLLGPVRLEALGPGNARLGRGAISVAGPALAWAGGEWRGLGPLTWMDMAGRGTWEVPAGWRRDREGRILAAGPILWKPLVPSNLLGLSAERAEATPGFLAASLDGVVATFEDGQVRSPRSWLDPAWISWPDGLDFQRKDGWAGKAARGRAPRPEEDGAPRSLEVREVEASRAVPGGTERIRARGARWTPEGLLLEGEVTWEQPLEGSSTKLVAPRLVMRDALGPALPPDLAPGQARAEGQATLTWGRRVLGSPRILVDRARRTWSMEAPVLGRGEQGTFTAGAGRGGARAWTFEGPVVASLFNGGVLRGLRLAWEGETWTLSGRPAVFERLRERLGGPRVVRSGERITFPEGMTGRLRAVEGDLAIQADHAESEGDRIVLRGQVECDGLGWQVSADSLTVLFGPGHVARQVQARGAVTLRGRMGEGRGESLEVDPVNQQARWQGRVRGLSEDLGR